MKIGIVTTWFERGAAYVSRQYVDALRASGHEVFVYARGGESYAKGDPNWDFDWVHWGKRSLLCDRSWTDRGDLKNWLLKNHIELVLFNEQQTWGPVLLCRELGLKTVAYIDYYTEKSVPNFALYDALICNTKRHLSAFDWHPGVFYVPWGTDTELFSPQDASGALVASDLVTFFHSAGMSPFRKGTDLLLRAFEQVKGRTRLIIHTQVDLVAVFPNLSELIEKLESTGRLECITKTVTAPGLYHLGDVYVYPTRLEGIGLTICEAQACGLPVIVPDCAPMNEFVPNDTVGRIAGIDRLVARHDGYYWPQCWVNLESLAAQMQVYVDAPESTEASKKAALQYARESRSWDSNRSELDELLEQVTLCGKLIDVPVESGVSCVMRNIHWKLSGLKKRVMNFFHSS